VSFEKHELLRVVNSLCKTQCMTEQPGVNGVPEFHLGDRLAKALDVAGISYQEMADYLGVSRNTIGNYIHMRTPVTVGTLRLWAFKTGVRMEWLQSGKAPSGGDPGEGQAVENEDVTELSTRERARVARTARPTTRQYAVARAA